MRVKSKKKGRERKIKKKYKKRKKENGEMEKLGGESCL